MAHQLRGDADNALARVDEEALEGPGDVAAVLERPDPLGVELPAPVEELAKAGLARSGGLYIFGALRAGASGFMLKRARPEELIAAVHTLAAGDSLLSPSVTSRVIDRMAHQPVPDLADQAKLDELTPREREVLELVARGLSNREIAAELVVEESTIRSHIRRILMKLELRDRVQIVIFAYETGVNRPAAADPTPQ